MQTFVAGLDTASRFTRLAGPSRTLRTEAAGAGLYPRACFLLLFTGEPRALRRTMLRHSGKPEWRCGRADSLPTPATNAVRREVAAVETGTPDAEVVVPVLENWA